MAGKGETCKVLNKHKFHIAEYLDIEEVTIYLRKHGMFTAQDRSDILSLANNFTRTEAFIDILAKKSLRVFQEFCACLETFSPHLLNIIASDHTGNIYNSYLDCEGCDCGSNLTDIIFL